MSDSLVRVSRRDDKRHFVKVSHSHDGKTELKPNLLHSGYNKANTTSHRFLFSNFRYSLTLFSKCFASFPHGTCSLSVSHQYLALDGIYHPLRAAVPNNSTRRKRTVRRLNPPSPAGIASPDYNSEDFQSELFPLQSPLLRESLLVSFPPLNNMLKFSGSASCVQSFDDSLDIAIRITYRISLRSSSLWEPRHPLLKVLNRYFCFTKIPNQNTLK
eukprot:GSChrysophyteH1.ASY1.ANO1.1235.1 assembled CDS